MHTKFLSWEELMKENMLSFSLKHSQSTVEKHIFFSFSFFLILKVDHFSQHAWPYLTVHYCAEIQWLESTDLGWSSSMQRVVMSLSAGQSSNLMVATEGSVWQERERYTLLSSFWLYVMQVWLLLIKSCCWNLHGLKCQVVDVFC